MPNKPMQVDLSGRTAIVTGGATGIGRAISVALGRCGASVVVSYNTSEQAAGEVVAEIGQLGGTATSHQTDVTQESDVEGLISHAKERFGRIDIMVANAGTPTERTPSTELTSEQWEHGLAVNCNSVFFCGKHVIPELPDGTGRLIVTSSVSARTGGGVQQISYAAAKAAVENMVRHWAKEQAPRGVTVNAVAPGIIRTRIHEIWTPPDTYEQMLRERVPMQRDGLPEDCVGSVLLLAGDDGSYITGQVIGVNGGMLMV